MGGFPKGREGREYIERNGLATFGREVWELAPSEFLNFMQGRKHEDELLLEKVRYLAWSMYRSSGMLKRGELKKPQDLFKLDLDKPKNKEKVIVPSKEQIFKAWQLPSIQS